MSYNYIYGHHRLTNTYSYKPSAGYGILLKILSNLLKMLCQINYQGKLIQYKRC